MTQEEDYGKFVERLHPPHLEFENDSHFDDDTASMTSLERNSAVKDMIMRFERGFTATNVDVNCEDEEYGERLKNSTEITQSGSMNGIHAHLAQLFPVPSQGRSSSISVNSILSGISETSFGSESSGIGSDRKSGSEFGNKLSPYRTAPPPPEPFNDYNSCMSRSPVPDDNALLHDEDPKDFAYSHISPNTSPVVLRRARQPPVIRRKSIAESPKSKDHNGEAHWSYGVNQSDLVARQPPVIRRKSIAEGSKSKDSEVHWSYGVKQSDLEKLLKIRRRITDTESDAHSGGIHESDDSVSIGDVANPVSDQSEGEDTSMADTDIMDDARADAASTDHSTDTLINEDDDESDHCDSSTVASEFSERRSNVDNLSIRSISSFDMVPYQKYDSITVSSDEYGSEMCPAPSNECLSVSAVNEFCVSKSSSEPVLIPVETKKEKYRRRLNERVNELLHTESLYVEKLRHVVDDYIPELSRTDAPPTLRGLRFDIFANIDKIYRFHAEDLLPGLRSCENDLKKLGQCFRRFEQKFHMYVIYSRNNKRSNRLVNEREHKKFFQEKQMQLGERLDISSYLLEPVQRIPRYKLFLDDLVKTYQNYDNERTESDSVKSKLSVDSNDTGGSNGESSESDETTLQSLQMAKAMIESLLTTVDDIIALENIRECPINLLNQGKLLRQYEFSVLDPARRRSNMRVFLFEKVVLLTLVYKKQLTVEVFPYRDHIPVDDLGITAKEHDKYKFSIWYKKRTVKAYKLETAEKAVRAAWVDEISALLWKQAMLKKEMILRSRSARNSTISVTSQQSSEGEADSMPADKYNSLRGVPGEVRRAKENRENRRTTWYFE